MPTTATSSCAYGPSTCSRTRRTWRRSRCWSVVTNFVCSTCGTQYPESDEPPAECPICCDDRQYVPEQGQQWTTLDDVRTKHGADIREVEPQLTGVGMEPEFAIGERALLVESAGGNV